MARGKRLQHTLMKIVNVLRQIEVAIANGKTTPAACKKRKPVYGTELLPLAQGAWRSEGGPGDAAERAGAGDRKDHATGRRAELGQADPSGHCPGKLLSRSVGAPLWACPARAERVSDMRATWSTSRVAALQRLPTHTAERRRRTDPGHHHAGRPVWPVRLSTHHDQAAQKPATEHGKDRVKNLAPWTEGSAKQAARAAVAQ